MHIPDGFVDAKTAVTTASLSAVALGLALRRAKTELPARRIPLLGLSAAFIFVAQMVNFPVAGGTSGHLTGAVLASVLLGPGPAMVAMSAVLIIQCLLFADGGLSALGANILNMAVVGTTAGYALYRPVRRLVPGHRGVLLGAGFAAWCATVLSASLCAGELAWSGTIPWLFAFPAMANVHMLVGIGEGAITMLALALLLKARPDLLEDPAERAAAGREGAFVVSGALVVVALALFVAPFASSLPDGLEHVASSFGIATVERSGSLLQSPFVGYTLPWIRDPVTGTALAACVGAAVVFGLALLFARALVPAGGNSASPPGEPAQR